MTPTVNLYLELSVVIYFLDLKFPHHQTNCQGFMSWLRKNRNLDDQKATPPSTSMWQRSETAGGMVYLALQARPVPVWVWHRRCPASCFRWGLLYPITNKWWCVGRMTINNYIVAENPWRAQCEVQSRQQRCQCSRSLRGTWRPRLWVTCTVPLDRLVVSEAGAGVASDYGQSQETCCM